MYLCCVIQKLRTVQYRQLDISAYKESMQWELKPIANKNRSSTLRLHGITMMLILAPYNYQEGIYVNIVIKGLLPRDETSSPDHVSLLIPSFFSSWNCVAKS